MVGMAARPEHVPESLVVDFDYYNPPGAELDYHEAWAALRSQCPSSLIWTPRNGGHWIPLEGRLIFEVLADNENFSTHVVSLPETRGKSQLGIPTTLSPPEHGKYRALLNHGLSPKAIAGLEPRIRSLAIQLIEDIAPRGACEFTTDYAVALPLRIFMTLVDLPESDIPTTRRLAEQVTRPDGTMTMAEIMAGFHAYLGPYLDARRARPGNDMLSYIINARIDGEEIRRDYAMSLCVQLLIGGMDTVASFLSFAMLFLARHPDHRRQLVEDRSLIPGAVDELLRRFAIVTLVRTAKKDMTLRGVSIKAGDHMSIPSVLHGLDEKEYPEPMKVDFRRPVRDYSTFGNGVHRCPGAFLARTEVRITLEEWMGRIPQFEVKAGHDIAMRGGVVGSIVALPLTWRSEHR
ncbi:MAG: cytochrome P450 [Dehalococcoidia bacterium]